jgi:hypothetical protein
VTLGMFSGATRRIGSYCTWSELRAVSWEPKSTACEVVRDDIGHFRRLITVNLAGKSQCKPRVNTSIWRQWCHMWGSQISKFMLQRSRNAPIKLAWIGRVCGFG